MTVRKLELIEVDARTQDEHDVNEGTFLNKYIDINFFLKLQETNISKTQIYTCAMQQEEVVVIGSMYGKRKGASFHTKGANLSGS